MSFKLYIDEDASSELSATFKSFPDVTQAIKIDFSQIATPANTTIQIQWDYENDSEMATLYYITKHLQANKFKVQLKMQYIPNARMDRVENSDEVFTLKYFADFINNLNFTEVLVLDAHSSVSLALINNVVQLDIKDKINEAISKSNPDIIFMPDEGAHKRYSKLTKTLPSTFGIKHRDWRTGDIIGYDLAEPELVKGAHVLIIDDISSFGGTFFFAAQALLKMGAKSVDLYVTHAEVSILKGKLLEDNSPITNIFIGNPLFNMDLAKDHTNMFKI